MHATLHHIEQITPTIVTLWFTPEQPVRYVAGQFTELFLPHDNVDERGVRRWFTLSSSPTEKLLGITTRLSPDKPSTFKQELASLQPGMRLHLADPMGDFVLPKNTSIPLVFVAAGLGITPVRSMVKWLHDTGEQRSIKLLFATSQNETAFSELFNNYGLELQLITQDRRALTAESISQHAGDDALIYLSGPEELVEVLYKQLKRLGIDPSRLVADYFPGYKD